MTYADFWNPALAAGTVPAPAQKRASVTRDPVNPKTQKAPSSGPFPSLRTSTFGGHHQPDGKISSNVYPTQSGLEENRLNGCNRSIPATHTNFLCVQSPPSLTHSISPSREIDHRQKFPNRIASGINCWWGPTERGGETHAVRLNAVRLNAVRLNAVRLNAVRLSSALATVSIGPGKPHFLLGPFTASYMRSACSKVKLPSSPP